MSTMRHKRVSCSPSNLANEAVDQVRRQGTRGTTSSIKGRRYIFLKNVDHLTQEGRRCLGWKRGTLNDPSDADPHEPATAVHDERRNRERAVRVDTCRPPIARHPNFRPAVFADARVRDHRDSFQRRSPRNRPAVAIEAAGRPVVVERGSPDHTSGSIHHQAPARASHVGCDPAGADAVDQHARPGKLRGHEARQRVQQAFDAL